MRRPEFGVIAQREQTVATIPMVVQVMPATFGAARIGYGRAGFFAYDDAWDYPSISAALKAMVDWDPNAAPEPEGWHRHVTTQRYRPDGDASKEYVKRDN